MQHKIKVLHIADKFGVNGSSVTGVGRLFSWWLPRFDPARFDVRLVGLRAFDASAAHIAAAGVDVDCLWKGKFELSTAGALRQIVREWQADIVHLHGYGATNFGRIATRGMPIRVVVHEHFVDPRMPLYQQVADYMLAPITDAAIAVSESVREFMASHRRIPLEKLRVIYNGAPLADFNPVSEQRAAQERRRWGLPEGSRIVGAVGRLDEQKGLTYLLEAAAILTTKGVDARYVIVGDGPLLEPLEEQASNYGIRDRVVFTGYTADTRPIQSTFDIQVFPSLWEGTPLTAFEAMAMGRSIVSTDVDGLGEILEDGRNALLVGPQDSLSLSEGLRLLLEQPEHAAALARRAAADSHRYDIAETVRQLQDLYDELTADRQTLPHASAG